MELMYLSPAEEDRLLTFLAAELARRSLGRGLRLNAPEATALAADEMHLAARAGGTFEEVREAGRRAVTPDALLPGVAGLVDEIRVEVLLEEGTRLVVLREPWGTPPEHELPGAVECQGGWIESGPAAQWQRLLVRNTSRRPVRVSSHYPFWQVNERLEFDRAAAYGFRLDIPSGSSVRWDPGQEKEVTLVRYLGGYGHGG
jgi:urease subunit gamma/beta